MRTLFERTENCKSKYIHTQSIILPISPLESNFDMKARSHLCTNKPPNLDKQGVPITLTLLYDYTQLHWDHNCFEKFHLLSTTNRAEHNSLEQTNIQQCSTCSCCSMQKVIQLPAEQKISDLPVIIAAVFKVNEHQLLVF